MKFKYIIVEKDGIEHPIIFSKLLEHKDILANFLGVRRVSAGFVQFGDGEWDITALIKPGKPIVSCFGKSTSLDLNSRPEHDAALMEENYKFEV